MLHGPRRVGMYCSPGKHGALDREGWWKRGKPCEVVVAYGIDPVLFMLAAQVFGSKESEFDVAGGMMGRGIELTDAQKTKIAEINAKYQPELQAVRESMQGGGDRAEAMKKMQEINDKRNPEIRAVLTADQQVIYDKNLAEQKARMEQMRQGGAPGPR